MKSEREQLKALLSAGVLTQAEYDAALSGAEDEVLTIAADGSGDFADLGEAIVEAPGGATLSIAPGLYRLTERVTKELSLVAQGPGVVLMPLGAEAFYARHREALDAYLAVYGQVRDNVIEEVKLKREAKEITFNLLRKRAINKSLKALEPAHNPEVKALHERCTQMGKELMEMLGDASILSVRGARVRISGLKFAWPQSEIKDWDEHPQLKKLKWPHYIGVDVGVSKRFREHISGLGSPKSGTWYDGGGLVRFLGEGADHGLIIRDCQFHGGGVAGYGVHAKSSHPEAALEVTNSDFSAFFINKGLREQYQYNVWGPDEAALHIDWRGNEPGAEAATLKVTGCQMEGGLSGLRIRSGSQVVLRDCAIRKMGTAAIRVFGFEFGGRATARLTIHACTMEDNEECDVLGHREDDGYLNYSAHKSQGAFLVQESTKGKEARLQREALEKARKEEERRQAEAKRRAEQERQEARRKAEQARADKAAAAKVEKKRRAEAAARDEEYRRLAEASRRKLAALRQKRASAAQSTQRRSTTSSSSRSRKEVIPDLPLEVSSSPSSSAPRRQPSPPPRPSSSHRCEWCSTPIDGHYCYNPKQMLFMSYRKGIFCSRQCQRRAKIRGFEGTKHTVRDGEIIELHFIE